MPLQAQIYRRYRDLIVDGRLRPGQRVPSLRAAACELGVAKGTVEAAYDRLVGEGFLVCRGAAGTFVASDLSPTAGLLPFRGEADTGNAGAGSTPASGPASDRVGDRAGAGVRSRATPARRLFTLTAAPLAIGLPALDRFPRKTWSRLTTRHARAGADLLPPEPQGLASLRKAIATYVHRARGLACSPDQVFIVPGYVGALSLTVQALLARGDRAWVESPGFPYTTRGLQTLGLETVPIPVDDQGLVVGEAIRRAPGARLAVVTPSHQSPLGVAMSLSRRRELLGWASRADGWILEDDYDGEFRYRGVPLPALASLDESGQVVYVGTFSKVLYPGLRLAYVVAPDSQVDRFGATCRWATFGGCPGLLQSVVADFIDSGHFGRHIRRMRMLYAERREWLARALQETGDTDFEVLLQDSGLHLLVRVGGGLSDVALVLAARRIGFVIHPLSRWSVDGVGIGNALLLGFTNVVSLEEARQRVATLREAWRSAGLVGPAIAPGPL